MYQNGNFYLYKPDVWTPTDSADYGWVVSDREGMEGCLLESAGRVLMSSRGMWDGSWFAATGPDTEYHECEDALCSEPNIVVQTCPPPPPPPACTTGLEVENPDNAVFQWGDGNGYYENNANCRVTATCTADGQVPQVTFTSFDTESNFDYVNIYDGATSDDTRLVHASGTTAPDPTSATQGSLLLQLTTDSSVVQTGFVASISCTDAAAQRLRGQADTITVLDALNGGEKTRAASALSRVRLDVAASTVAAALKRGDSWASGAVPVPVQHTMKTAPTGNDHYTISGGSIRDLRGRYDRMAGSSTSANPTAVLHA